MCVCVCVCCPSTVLETYRAVIKTARYRRSAGGADGDFVEGYFLTAFRPNHKKYTVNGRRTGKNRRLNPGNCGRFTDVSVIAAGPAAFN